MKAKKQRERRKHLTKECMHPGSYPEIEGNPEGWCSLCRDNIKEPSMTKMDWYDLLQNSVNYLLESPSCYTKAELEYMFNKRNRDDTPGHRG